MVLTRQISRQRQSRQSRHLRSGRLVIVAQKRTPAAGSLTVARNGPERMWRKRRQEKNLGQADSRHGLDHDSQLDEGTDERACDETIGGLSKDSERPHVDSNENNLSALPRRFNGDPMGGVCTPSLTLRPDTLSTTVQGESATTQSPRDAEMLTTGEYAMIDPEGVGLPVDERWYHDAAYDKRYCFKHGQDEFLLGTPPRWMRPEDFGISAAAERLGRLWKQFQQRPAFDPHARRHQAECTTRLWAHVDNVLEKSTYHGQIVYRVLWKACWTPRSYIDDEDWLAASLMRNQDPRRHRSSRLEQTAWIRAQRNEEIMRVVRLESTDEA